MELFTKIKIMKKLNICFFIVIIFIGCNSKNSKEDKIPVQDFSATYDKKLVSKLLGEAINEGNTNSYRKVASLYFRDSRYTDFYFYSMLMASKYNYSRAYFDSYMIMNKKGIEIDGIKLYSDDYNTRKMANYFLLKSYELGLKEAKGNLTKIFGEKFPKSNEYFCEEK